MRSILVIDASVALAAGETNHPTSMACRDFLAEVFRICHRAVMTIALKKEWEKHASMFSTHWRAAMVSRGKMYDCEPQFHESLEKSVRELAPNPTQEREMLKDIHLLDAALVHDKIVASLDGKARKLFADLASSVPEIHGIAWVDPTIPEEKPLNWLRSGARNEAFRRLGSRKRRPKAK
jgi:hypothetical protein